MINLTSLSPYHETHKLEKQAVTLLDKSSLKLAGNNWVKVDFPYEVTANTVLTFEFQSNAQGEIHGIGFDDDNKSTQKEVFQLYGTQSYGLKNFNNYAGNAGTSKSYKIPVGQFYTGEMKYLFFVNDHDIKNPSAESVFRNVRVYENAAPVAVDDSGITLKSAPVTFKVSDLLSNDSDIDGDKLSLRSLKAINGGSVISDKQGNIIFTPTKNFTGQASFEYTITDEFGASDTATVTVEVKNANIGINLAGITYYSSQQPFLDLFKSSSGWITQGATKWDTKESTSLVTDENGWVKSLSGTGSTQQFTRVSTLINRDIKGNYSGGRYIVLYDGEGTLQYSYDAKKVATLSKPGRDVIDVTPTNSGVFLQITATDPNNNGNYLKNIRIVPEAYESSYSTEIFNPEFLRKIDSFSTLRYMDWMKTNNSTQSLWSDRPRLDSRTWATKGAPVEIMVELANRVDSNPWFTIPHLATDDYVTQFATYVRDHIEPGLKVYVELSNEVWNPQFTQNQWAENLSTSENYAQSYGKRATQVMNIWDKVFGDKKDQVIGVMGAQRANPWTASQAMMWADSSIDAIAVAPYVGGYLGNKQYEKQVESWANDPDNGLNKLFDELLNGGVLNNGPVGGALANTMKTATTWKALSQKYNLPIIAYEGGQHLVGVGDVVNNQEITNLFIKANQDPRMGEVYNKLFTQWYQVLGGDLFVHYKDVGMPGKWGSWGALEYLGQENSPKYDTLMNFMAAHTAGEG